MKKIVLALLILLVMLTLKSEVIMRTQEGSSKTVVKKATTQNWMAPKLATPASVRYAASKVATQSWMAPTNTLSSLPVFDPSRQDRGYLLPPTPATQNWMAPKPVVQQFNSPTLPVFNPASIPTTIQQFNSPTLPVFDPSRQDRGYLLPPNAGTNPTPQVAPTADQLTNSSEFQAWYAYGNNAKYWDTISDEQKSILLETLIGYGKTDVPGYSNDAIAKASEQYLLTQRHADNATAMAARAAQGYYQPTADLGQQPDNPYAGYGYTDYGNGGGGGYANYAPNWLTNLTNWNIA